MPVAFVTGVTGQDGTYLASDLVASGYEVHGLVKPDDSAERLPPGVTAHHGDLRDTALVRSLLFSVRPDEVYNLAGQTSVAASWTDPFDTAVTTGATVAAMADACWILQQELGRQVRLLQASSAEVFGVATDVPQNEFTVIAPVSPYGAAKAFGQNVVKIYRQLGLHASSCILYNHESALRPESFVTRKITAGAARISRGLQDELRLGSLEVARDWGWAPDYVRAMQLAVRYDMADDYVIGTGVHHTVREFVNAAFLAVDIPDWEGLVVQDPSFVRPVDPPTQLADSSHARKVLGWTPSISFNELVALMVRADLAAIDQSDTGSNSFSTIV